MKVFGKNPTGTLQEKVKSSPNYTNGIFQNLSPTVMLAEGASYWKMIGDMFKRNPERIPSVPLPSVKSDLEKKQQGVTLHWFGHSSYLLSVDGYKILVDPVLSGYASPFSFGVRAFNGSDVYKPEDFGVIDLLVLTHDHYDHMDYHTLLNLKPKVKKIICSLGLASHLQYWGFPKDIITELDWWKDKKVSDSIHITATPARHFSGRTFKRAQTLWSSFVLQTTYGNIYIGGDSGYDAHFKEIQKAFSEFDLALLECGQYNEKWPMIHMMPEQTAQAAVDLNAGIMMPVHWGKFALAYHPWYEPVERVSSRSAELGVKLITPMIGEEIIIGDKISTDKWWNSAISTVG